MSGEEVDDEDCPASIDVVLDGRKFEVPCGPMYLHSRDHEGTVVIDGKVRVDITWTVVEGEPAFDVAAERS